MAHKIFISGLDMINTLGSERQNTITVATLLQAHLGGWAFECLGPNVPLELEPTRGGLIIQCGRYLEYLTPEFDKTFN